MDMDPSTLAKYEIYTEVPLTTQGGFMKADIVFVKRKLANNTIDNVIIIENKLSSSTHFTKRQKEAWKKLANGEDLYINYRRIEVTDSELKVTNSDFFSADNIKTFKVHSNARNTDVSNVSIEAIDVNEFKNYTPRN